MRTAHADGAADERAWSRRSIVAAAFVVAYLAVQVALGVRGLVRPGPSPLAWHMYSRLRPPRTYAIVQGGTETGVSAGRYAPHWRAELDLEDVLPAHLCAVLPNVDAVVVRDTPDGPRGEAHVVSERVHPCR